MCDPTRAGRYLPGRGMAPCRLPARSQLFADVRQPRLWLDGTSLAEILRGLDLVVHGAAATGFNLDEGVYREVNIDGTANLLT